MSDALGIANLVDVVATQSSLTKKASREIIDAVFAEITKKVAGGGEVNIAGFGKFRPRHTKAKEGRNPKTGAVIQIAAKTSPAFAPAKAFKDAVAK